MKKILHLALADGSIFSGRGFMEGDDIVTGEIVFSTSTTGYTELLTDPSYYGQIVVLANPEIGNYGVNHRDFQSDGIKVKALVVRNLSTCASSHRAEMTLLDFLMREQIPVMFGVDTRAIISHIREVGAMMAAISEKHSSANLLSLVDLARNEETMNNKRLSTFVGINCAAPFKSDQKNSSSRYHVVAMDFGVKRAILNYLEQFGARITLVPGDSSPEEIWSHAPDGLFLSNGPGDPKTETSAVNTVRALLGKLPIFGVCLGHQILGQALGYETFKLAYGHRGSNQAVKCVDETIITTAQNHGFAVNSLSAHQLAKNISDGTNEGIEDKNLFAFSVQFHPEGAPGPTDALFYFEKFMRYIDEWKNFSKDNGYQNREIEKTNDSCEVTVVDG